MSRAILITLVLTAALLGAGCARHLPVSDIGASGGDVGVRVVTITGEIVTGQLLALDGEQVSVRVTRRESGEVNDRTFPIEDVASATLHRRRSETSFGPFVSTAVGVAGGLLLAAVLGGAGL